MSEFLLRLLVDQVELVWSGVLRGDIDGRSRVLAERMRVGAKIGELVVITHVGRDVPASDRIGWLETIEDAPLQGEWPDDERRPLVRYWTIRRLGSGTTIRWENVAVLRVLREDARDQLVSILHAESTSGEKP